MTFVSDDIRLKSVPAQRSRATVVWALWFVGIVGITAVLGLFLLQFGTTPAIIGWLLYLIGIAAILYQPRYGIYLIIFFAIVGDAVMMEWYPFGKNFSSIESLFYLHDALIISPLESYLALTFISWLGRAAVQRRLKIHTGLLFWSALFLLAFAIFGLLYGIGTGGNINIALWEVRAIFYLPLFLLLTSNLFTERKQANHLMWIIMLALFIEGILGSYIYFVILNRDLGLVDAITEHGAAIHMNTLFIFALAVWLYKGSWSKRILLPLMSIPVLFSYLASQRRASFIVLIIAIGLMTLLLYRESRKLFWTLVPAMGLVGIMYLAIFWNNTSSAGLPAQAIKSVIAEDQASAKDRSSNIYRDIENINASYTIHQQPLTGVGFGQPFYFLVELPDISNYIWWEYVTHNSIAWIWMKTGVGGFLALLFFIGTAVMTGIRVLWRMPRNDMSAIAVTAILYIIMHFIYAYADMSWDAPNMVYVGVMMGLINSLERIVDQPIPIKPKRWSWQPDKMPPPGLTPLSGANVE